MLSQTISRAPRVRVQDSCARDFFKVVAVLLFLATAARPVLAAPAYVQGAHFSNMTAAHTIEVAYPQAQTAGNLNVVAIGWNDDTTTLDSITDTAGNTYILAAGPTRNLNGGATQYLFYAKNIAPASAGINVVTITVSSASLTWPETRIAEYSGIDNVSPLDAVAANAGNSATTDSGQLTTTNANDIIVGVNYVANTTTEAGPGFTARFINNGNILQDRLTSSTGAYSSTAPLQDPGWWIMQAAAFKASPADSQAPSVPTALTVTAASSTQLNVTWQTAADNIRTTAYRVERCTGSGCSNFAEIGTTAENLFSDVNLTAGTSYSYRLRAQDAALNISSYSGSATATTLTAGAGINYVQGAAHSGMTSPLAITVTYPQAQSAGNLNVVSVGWNDQIGTLSSITDSAGNTYALAIRPTRHPDGQATQYLYYAKNIVAAAAGTNTVTVTLSEGDLAWPEIRVAEYSGLSTTNPLDVAVGQTGSGANTSSGQLTTTHANDLIVAINYVQHSTTGPGPGYVQRYIQNGNILEDRVTTATGTYVASAPSIRRVGGRCRRRHSKPRQE